GRSPVAIGSSVPRWPMLRSRCARLTSRTTPADVIPAGLSTSRMPSALGVGVVIVLGVAVVALVVVIVVAIVVALGNVLARGRPLGLLALLALPPDVAQQRVDAPRALELLVEGEEQLGRVAQAELARDHAAEERRRALETALRLQAAPLVHREQRERDLREAQVVVHVHAG